MSLSEKAVPIRARPEEVSGDRIVFHLAAHFQSLHDQPDSHVLVYSEEGKSGIEPYSRRLIATTELSEVDFGWVTSPGFIRIDNLERATERQEDQERFVRERTLFLPGGWEVPPGMFFVGRIKTKIEIHSGGARVKYRVTVYPKL